MWASLRACRVVALGLLLLVTALPGYAVTASDLRCDYRVHPLDIDNLHPCLGWILRSDRRAERQTAYQILVATRLDRLTPEHADLWNSGKVHSSNSVAAPYQGKALTTGAICYWKVRAWDKSDKAGPWSGYTSWEMGLLSPQDWRGQWINDGRTNPTQDADFYREDPAPQFRKEFTLSRKIARARLFISGLGYYEAHLNGERVGDRCLDPGWTRYSARALYSTYDVTRQLQTGANCLGVTLGNGWYNPLPLRMWGRYDLRDSMPVGRPRFIAQLEITFKDGGRQTVSSDTTWQVADGPIRFNSIYLGEVFDARHITPGWDRPGFQENRDWRQPAIATEPMGALRAQSQPPIRVTETLKPVMVTEPKPGVFIYDMGRNFAGWIRMRRAAPAGTKILLRYGELLNKDGTLNPMTSVAGQVKGTHKTADGTTESIGGPGAPPVAWQSDTYIASGNGIETYVPRFTFHGFRYVEMTGIPGQATPEMLTGLALNADVPRVLSFTCSDPLFNQIQQMCDRTFRSNLFSVQSDCPHRERFGYGGDIAATSEAFMMNYDMANFYAKFVRDEQDSALPDDMLTDTAPYVGIQYCGVAWAMAHPLLQRQLYRYYGNKQLIEEQYDTSRRWLDLVTKQYPDHIVKDGLNDHEGLDPAPTPVMVTPLYAAGAETVGELAQILGREADAAQYQQLATEIRKTYAEKFVDPTTGKVGPGTQGSQAFALYLDALPTAQRDAALTTLLSNIHDAHQDHLTTGIFGTKYLLDVLSREGHSEVANTLVSQKTFPGWGWMLENGATTLWEHWAGSDNTYSQNHPMFGSVSQWFVQWLGGIQPGENAVGFDHIVLRPQLVGHLTQVVTRYHSVRGDIVSNWVRNGQRVFFYFDIPANTSALVYLPTTRRVIESGIPAAKAPGVTFVHTEAHQTIYQIGSGRYEFDIIDPDRTP
jgi:alpha-L-rhamnosidase